MSFLRNRFFHRLLMVMFAIGAFEGAAYAQFTVNLTGHTPHGAPIQTGTSTPAPSDEFNVRAAILGNPVNPITKVVFYRNDVPYKTVTTSPYRSDQPELGQDTYIYRARAYDSTGFWVDSNDFKLTVHTRQVIRMGDSWPVKTDLPNRDVDHTDGIRDAVTWLGENNGGTLFFPCTIPPFPETIAVYNIKSTINIPSNVTLQGEGAEANGRCRIYWNDVLYVPPPIEGEPQVCGPTPSYLRNAPMFRIVAGPLGFTSGVRFKDLSLYSRTTGANCPSRSDFEQIASDNTAAIEMNTDYSDVTGDFIGNITDVIVENVSILNFTDGIRAISATATEKEISDIRIRAYRAVENHRQLYINARYAYNWDVQNLNINSMRMVALNGVPVVVQGGVEIVNAGKPASAVENTTLKFLQLNCNGGLRAAPDSFCVRVEKHGGLYFRQMHHEGVNNALIVENISLSTTTASTNPDPIVLESGVATGKFYDASMKVYLIGSSIFAPEVGAVGLDSGRLRFLGDGVASTLVDCGDIHLDVTNTNPTPSPTPSPYPDWPDIGMYHSHAERNRGSFFAEEPAGTKFIKAHTYCPQGDPLLTDINKVGGEYFDSGVMPTEAGSSAETERLYSHVISTATCPGDVAICIEDRLDYNGNTQEGGSVYITGSREVSRTVNIRSGSQIVGAPEAQLTLTATGQPLFRIDLPASQNRISSIVIRNLKLRTGLSSTTTGTGIAIQGSNAIVGVSSDLHFSGLIFEGFDIGFYGGSYTPFAGHPMMDGVSLKNMSFDNNLTAVKILSDNTSNWNIMNLRMTSSFEDSIGWDQKGGGHQSLQNVACQGAPLPSLSAPLYSMTDCMKLKMTGTYLAGFKQTEYVTNSLHIQQGSLAHLVIRDSDFRSSATTESRVKLLGRAFIVSLNNKYNLFDVQTDPYYLYRGDHSRLTYCGDTYQGEVYTGLGERHLNFIVGAPTLTRVQCGSRPMPWDDPVRLGGGAKDQPLVGNFNHDVREDFVIYREGIPGATQSKFLIKHASDDGFETIDWGLMDDIPLIGRFFPGSRAQIVIWRPSTGYFWVKDPNTSGIYGYHWGMQDDVPFIGNFMPESDPGITGNKDEVAVYRPSNQTFYILNPRSGQSWAFTTNAHIKSKIQVGDFLGYGYDQIAQYKEGLWEILDTRNPSTPHSATLGEGEDDVPVAGKYLPGLCTQIAVWRPTVAPPLGSLEPVQSKFIIADPFCGSPSTSLVWGSNNEFNSTALHPDDIPLTINTTGGPLRKPTAYRPTTGAFQHSLSNGQWWVHDPFPF